MAKQYMLTVECIWLDNLFNNLMKLNTQKGIHVRRYKKQNKKIVADHLGIEEEK